MTHMIPATSAQFVAEYIMGWLTDACDEIEVAGSLRRGAAYVSDVKLVARTGNAQQLLARLDRMVIDGTIKQALYRGKPRWGKKYREFHVAGIRVELFLADGDNWGYIYWLRTGPEDANAYVMQRLTQAPYRATDGYIWHEGRKLHVPDEIEMFRLLTGRRMVIPPRQRSISQYSQIMTGWAQEWRYAEEASMAQGRLLR